MFVRVSIIAGLLLFTSALAHAEGTFSWRDKRGVRHYSETCPSNENCRPRSFSQKRRYLYTAPDERPSTGGDAEPTTESTAVDGESSGSVEPAGGADGGLATAPAVEASGDGAASSSETPGTNDAPPSTAEPASASSGETTTTAGTSSDTTSTGTASPGSTTPPSGTQSVPVVFQTTFDCADWNQTSGRLGDGDVCSVGDGIAGSGAWTTSNGSGDQIVSAANNPSGGGGKGFRHWRGGGTNNNGGGLTITLPTALSEMWVRFYMRYSAGFAWSGGGPMYTKEHYWGSCGAGCVIFGIQGSNSWGINYNGSVNHPSSLSWAASQGGNVGDGKWHLYEYHLKQNGSAGAIEIWVDGVRYLNATNVSLGSIGWRSFTLGSNQSTVSGCSSGCYTDYDDIAVSTVGRIGPH